MKVCPKCKTIHIERITVSVMQPDGSLPVVFYCTKCPHVWTITYSRRD